MASTTRYRDLLDYTVAYRTVWTLLGVAGVVALAGWLVWSYVKPPGEDERARADVKAAERLRGRAEGCVSPDLAALVQKRLEGGTEALDQARVLLLQGDHAGASAAAKEAGALLKEFIDQACVARESVAEFMEVAGEIRVKKLNSLRWVPARKDTQLEEGDKISAERGFAKVTTFVSGEVFEIRQGTVLEIRNVTVLPDGAVRVNTAMEKGDLTMQGAKDTGSTIMLPTGGEVEPGLDTVDIESRENSGQALVRSHVGGAKVRDTARGTVATLSQQSRVGLSVAAGLGQVEKDLPGPELATPVDGRVFTHENPLTEDTVLEWRPLEGARGGYLFQITVNDRFAFLLNPDSQVIEAQRVSALLAGLPPNLYFWRVAGLDAKGVRGRWSEARRFQVRSAAAAVARPENVKPPLVKVTKNIPAGDQVIIEGVTEPGVILECLVNGQKYQSVDVDEDGGFRAFILLPRGGKNVIAFVAQNAYGIEGRAETTAYFGID